MASELTYRGGGASTAASAGAGGYSPKPSKPLAWLPRAARYAVAENHPLFALAGMLITAAVISIASPSSSSSIAASSYSYSNNNPLARFSVEPAAHHRDAATRHFVGGKVPLGLKRKALHVLVTGGSPDPALPSLPPPGSGGWRLPPCSSTMVAAQIPPDPGGGGSQGG